MLHGYVVAEVYGSGGDKIMQIRFMSRQTIDKSQNCVKLLKKLIKTG